MVSAYNRAKTSPAAAESKQRLQELYERADQQLHATQNAATSVWSSLKGDHRRVQNEIDHVIDDPQPKE